MGSKWHKESIYLDGLSSTKPLDSVVSAMQDSISSNWGSTVSRHSRGRQISKILKQTRQQLKQWLECPDSSEIVFCSSGTEAVNLGILGAQGVIDGRKIKNEIVTSRVEHPSVIESLKHLEQSGFTIRFIEVDNSGRIDISHMTGLLSDQTAFVCLQAVNQDLGTIQPIAEVGGILEARGIPFFVDACYGCGWIDISEWINIADAVALSFHRFYGPSQIGALVYKSGFRMSPILHGGRQENSLRPGIENIHSIAGLSAWIDEVSKKRPQWIPLIAEKQKHFHQSLTANVDWLYLNGLEPGKDRICGNLHYSGTGIEGEGLVLRGDLKGLSLGSGSACLGRGENPEIVLKNLGASKHRILSSFQACPGLWTSNEDIDKSVSIISDCINFLRRLSPDWEELQRNPKEIEILMAFQNS